MRFIIMLAAALLGSSAIAQDAPLLQPRFIWPASTVGVLRDMRVEATVRDARETAREAETRAAEGRRAAAHSKRREALRSAFGAKPARVTTDDETEFAGSRGLGTVSYPSGATMTGAIVAGIGVYTGGPESSLLRFSGFVFGSQSAAPNCVQGMYEWKNGDVFTGDISGNGSISRGGYVEAGGKRRFVGEIDMSQLERRPLRGYVLDDAGKLLAIVWR